MITISIITCIFCIIWRRFITHTLRFYRVKKSIILVSIAVNISIIIILLSFPRRYQQLTQYTRHNPLQYHTALRYWGYVGLCSILGGITIFRNDHIKTRLSQFISYIPFSMISIIPVGGLPWYYLITASVEEYVKGYHGIGLYHKYHITKSDIIVFSIISGLGFACIENIAYIQTNYHTNGALQLTIMRGIIGPIIHCVCSGLIGYIYRKRSHAYQYYIIGIIIVALFHAGYNGYLSQYSRSLWLVIIIGYGIISWLIYQCDMIYLEEQTNTI